MTTSMLRTVFDPAYRSYQREMLPTADSLLRHCRNVRGSEQVLMKEVRKHANFLL